MRSTVFTITLILSLFSTISAENRALLVGIGKYDTRNTGWSEIHGDNDVEYNLDYFKKMIKFALYIRSYRWQSTIMK